MNKTGFMTPNYLPIDTGGPVPSGVDVVLIVGPWDLVRDTANAVHHQPAYTAQ